MVSKVPVLLIAYARPAVTQQAFEAIKEYQPKQFFFAVDGPADAATAPLNREVRAIVEQIDWDCEVQTLFHQENLGLRTAVPLAISWFFNTVEYGVILEDDCVASPDFFRFCEVGLDRLKDDTRIVSLVGSNVSQHHIGDKPFFLSHYPSVWGWATWRNRWALYDREMSRWDWPVVRAYFFLKWRNQPLRYLWFYFFSSIARKTTTWDYQWIFTMARHGMVCLAPAVNLVSNIGSSGTHHKAAGQSDWLFHPLGDISPEAFDSIGTTDFEIDSAHDSEMLRMWTGSGQPSLRWYLTHKETGALRILIARAYRWKRWTAQFLRSFPKSPGTRA
jgi:hypothetical protein